MHFKNVGITVCCAIVLIFFTQLAFAGTTGKISGQVVDKDSGQPLPGTNVLVVGTQLGAAADLNGNFTILHVPPGQYDLQASMIGYAKMIVQDIRVRIDQTTRVDFALHLEVISGEEVTVVAEKNIIKPDVATSVVAISDKDVATLPLSTVEEVVELQAGVQQGLVIRGGGADEALFLMDGITLRDPRNNQPITGIALSAIKEIAVERGGFNAEYGQIRSGLINVITQEGHKQGYFGSLSLKASPPAPKYFGISPYDKNSMWMRPYFDDAVCWTGTERGAWDKYTQRQYPRFDGWDKVSNDLLTDSNPNNDLSPVAAQRLAEWEHRRRAVTDQPDYDIDAGFGGPVPFIGNKLGNLRFFSSYRQQREMLLIPLTRDDYLEQNLTTKLTADISKSMRLTISGLTGRFYTTAINEGDEIFMTSEFGPNDARPTVYWYPTLYVRSPWEIAKVTAEQRSGRIFNDGWYSQAKVSHYSLAAKLTHTINSSTFYETSIEHIARKYLTGPIAERNYAQKYEIVPGFFTDEGPYGWSPYSTTGIGDVYFFFGGHSGEARDSTRSSATTFKFDLTSQVNFSNLVKTGFEFVYNDLNLKYGDVNRFTGKVTNVNEHQTPFRGAFYAQDKLETKGFILNLGLRLDFSNANQEWVKPLNPYDASFYSSNFNPVSQYRTESPKTEISLSPRLGISHPITTNSKLFFNYGHFKQLPAYEELLRIGRSGGAVKNYGDPNLALAKTISYELGYDHLLFNSVLIQAAAFYHDISDQLAYTSYASADGTVGYRLATSNSYEDIRGFEISLNKSIGWWSGFANYTYQVNTYGYFGKQFYYENQSDQRRSDTNTRLLYQGKPLPQPYARVSLMFRSPKDFGPSIIGINPLEECNVNFIYNYRAGEYINWPYNRQDIFDNIQTADYHNMALRFNKTVAFNKMQVTFFMEVENLFNLKRLSGAGFYDNDDYLDYMNSLHLPKSSNYTNIPGHDKPGDYRKTGVEFQPIEQVGSVTGLENSSGFVSRAIYYETGTKKYMNYVTGSWVEVEKGRVKKILDDKAYIDMPNQTSFNFLNPRQWFFGVKVTFDLQ